MSTIASWRFRHLVDRLFDPVDTASLVVMRVAFGLIMFVDTCRYWALGRIGRYYIEPGFYFKYYGFEWIQPWPGDGMYWHYAALAVLSALIAVGAFYRVATVLFFLGFSYVFLLDQAQYLNHFYLVILVSFLLCLVPAHRSFSVDAWLRPRLRSAFVPRWSIWTLRAQVEVVLLYAGIVKINADWLRLEPLSMWLRARNDLPIIGQWFFEDWVVAIGAYGIIALHIIGAPLLLNRRARPWVFGIYVCFHVLNHFVWNIGIFPWFTIVATLMFFEPDWPRRFGRWAMQYLPAPAQLATASSAGPMLKDSAAYWSIVGARDGPAGAHDRAVVGQPTVAPIPIRRSLLIGFLALWLAYQILFPLRHLLYPGLVSWTEEGHRFAWMMMLRDKTAITTFEVRNPVSGRTWRVKPSDHLTARQTRKMAGRPDMILQFAHHLARIWDREKGIPDVEVRASAWCALNGRDRARLIDRNRDLAKVERNLRPADWILPLTKRLHDWQ